MREYDPSKPTWFSITRGEKVWAEDMQNQGKWIAYHEIERGNWVGQYPLPGFRRYDYDILVYDAKLQEKL